MNTAIGNRSKESSIVQPQGVLNIVDLDHPNQVLSIPATKYGFSAAAAPTPASPAPPAVAAEPSAPEPMVSPPPVSTVRPLPPPKPDAWPTLKMPFLTPEPSPPRCQVIFELPQAGLISAWYHEVIESAGCVVLVYDTRFTHGMQYLPPDLDQLTIKFHIPERNRHLQVWSLGFVFELGCLACAILVKVSDQADTPAQSPLPSDLSDGYGER